MKKRVTKYSDLSTCVKVFNENRLEIMIIEGSAGTGKSSIVRNSIQHLPLNGYCWIEGRISAVCLFEKLYLFRGLPIIIDDVDGLYNNKECVNILKCLCQTEKVKRISWNTQNFKSDVPREFETESKMCIITNSWQRLNKHVGAVEDRGLLVEFHPTAQEVHEYVKTLKSVYNKEIHTYIGGFLSVIPEPSIRHYRNALQLIGSDLNWKEVLIESFGMTDTEMCVMRLINVDASENKKAKMFSEELGMSERSYWRTKAELEDKGIKF